jgi:hypothetical protein
MADRAQQLKSQRLCEMGRWIEHKRGDELLLSQRTPGPGEVDPAPAIKQQRHRTIA